MLLEHSIHDVDQIEQLGGPVTQVAATTAYIRGIEGIEDLAAATFRLRRRGRGQPDHRWHDLPERLNDRRVEVVCERMWAMLEGDWIGPSAGSGPESRRRRCRETPSWPGSRSWGSPAQPRWRLRDRGGRGSAGSPDFRDALRAHIVVDAAYRSAAAGAPCAVSARGRPWQLRTPSGVGRAVRAPHGVTQSPRALVRGGGETDTPTRTIARLRVRQRPSGVAQ